jgi:signal transduction histidine kinase
MANSLFPLDPDVEARAQAPARERSDEAARLFALHSYHVLDTPAEARFDRITKLLARALDVPMALISLVDAERQWFKARYGLDAESTPRDVAFCAHAIRGGETMVVEDAQKDARFAENPLVLGAPFVRFYAGAPLLTPEGHRLGTLCAIDQKPRTLDSEQHALLEQLSQLVMDLFELRRLARLKQDVDETVHALAHDLRPGLHQMKSFGELIASDSENRLSQRSQRYLALIQEVSERTRTRLDAVRDFLHASEVHEVARVQTANVVSGVLAKLSHLVDKRAATIEVGPLLPVLGRQVQIETLFTHLLDNALKYSGEHAKISVSSERLTDRVLFEVNDSGPGIPDGQRGRALRLFQRLHGADTPGNGVGLALCRKIVEVGGGKLLITERPGGGAAIRFTLPMAFQEA